MKIPTTPGGCQRGAQDPQRRADRGRRGVDGARHHAVHVAFLKHHGANHERVAEVLACDPLGPAAVLPQLDQRSDVTLDEVLRIDNGDAIGQPQPQVAGHPGHLGWRPEQDAARDATVRARDRGPHDTGLGALGQDNARVGRASRLDQRYRKAAGLSRRDRVERAATPARARPSASAMVSVTRSIRSRSSTAVPGRRSPTRVAVW